MMRAAKYAAGFAACAASTFFAVAGVFDVATLFVVWGFLMIYLADGEAE